MDFYEVLDQIIALLQRRGRVTYRALKRQFDLDDNYLDDLKDTLIYAHPVFDDGHGLVWTGAPATPAPHLRRGTEDERDFQALLPAVIGMLQGQRRVTYRTLKYVFHLDDALAEEIREELTLRRLAIDEEGKVLVWTGGAHPVPHSPVDLSSQPTTESTGISLPAVSTPPLVTETLKPSTGPTVPVENATTDTPWDEPVVPESARSISEAERRQLTVMFCDLADFTKLSQQLDPEDLRDVIRAYQQTSAEIIQRVDGYIAQHLGDGLLIYFGWPRAHEDDPQRALHAGLGIVEAITTTLNPRLEQDKGVTLAVRLGIHTGPVVVGAMGGGGRHENLATGKTVNIAARLEGLAAPNTVVVSSVTARLVTRAFALEDLGPQRLKGVSGSMRVFRVLGVTEDHEDEMGAVGIPFLVGRDEEVGLLLRRWDQSKAGLGQVVLICGEPGIGKSSLMTTLRHQVEETVHTRITFRCSPYHANSALYPVIDHIQRVLQFQPNDTPGAKLDKLERGLSGYTRPLDEIVPLYAALLAVPVPEEHYPARNLAPQQQRQQTQDALVGWLLEEAERQPTMAMWEDLHWADPSTLELLGLVLEQTPMVPMLHVLTYRPEFTPPWPMRSHMTPITLNRLERPQVEALILHLTGGKPLPAAVVEHIVGKTDGVPLYVEELTKMLLESDLLREGADQYVLTGPLLSVAIPDTLQDSLMARLDRLPRAREVAQLGAVLGREFPYEMLKVLTAIEEASLQERLAQLVDAEILYQQGRPPHARYVFKHALIRDTAYASLLTNTRQQMHKQVAQQLESQFPETRLTQPELVAYHYTEAGCHEQAISYWQRAGQRAREGSAHGEATVHLTRGLEILATLPQTPARDQQELTFQLGLGNSLSMTRGWAAPEVEDVYTRAQELCQQTGDTSQLFLVLLGLSQVYIVRADVPQHRDISLRLLSLAQSQQDPVSMMAAHWVMGVNLFHAGDYATSRAHIGQAYTRYDSEQHRTQIELFGIDLRVFALSYMAHTLWCLGYPEQALHKSHEAVALAQKLSHAFSRTVALAYTAMLYQFRRQTHAARKRAEATVALCKEHEFAYYLAWGTIVQGWIGVESGEVEEGIAEMQQGLAALQATGSGLRRPYYRALLAAAFGKRGHVAEGLRTLDAAFTDIEQTGERWLEAELYRLKGELLLHGAHSVRHAEIPPEACFLQALSIARSQQAKSWELRTAISLARLWQSQGKHQEAHDLLAPVYNWFTEGFDTVDLQEAKALLEALGVKTI